MTKQEATFILRRYQRHHLLRQFGDDGQVLRECIEVSEAINTLVDECEVPENPHSSSNLGHG